MIANFELATGQNLTPATGDTRTETDLVTHIPDTANTDELPLADQK